jgi:L-alanine-DL-glutamate epimerase-like enolase superfamily enzyme
MAPDKWTVTPVAVDLELAERFTIATESWDVAANVFVVVGYGGLQGVGEVAPDPRWGESQSSVMEELESIDLGRLAGPFDLQGILELMPSGSARSALDVALHDLAARLAGVSVSELLGTGGRSLPPTSVTVPIADISAMVARATKLRDHPVLKMKVGFEGDVDAVAEVRSVYKGRIRVDANEGWSPEQAIERLGALEAFEIELCEQPIPRGELDALASVTRSTAIPVFADEDVCTSRDVVRLAGVVDGVNLKLRKTGGMREAIRAMATARAVDLSVMLGCDLTSGIAATAEATLASLVDHADIDGPLLLARDPYPGVTYDKGRMTLPSGPGLGTPRFSVSPDSGDARGPDKVQAGEP